MATRSCSRLSTVHSTTGEAAAAGPLCRIPPAVARRRACITDTRTRFRCLPTANCVGTPAHDASTLTYIGTDTCIHFHGDERCIYQKPPHDTVCAIRKTTGGPKLGVN